MHGSTVARVLVGVDRPDAAGAVFQAATLLVPAAGEQDDAEATNTDPQPAAAQPVAEPPAGDPGTPFTGSAAIATGSYRCRCAGAMMLYPYLNLVGAQVIFATLTGGPARQPTSRPRPPTPHRRTQRHTNGYAHRPPATDLPARTGISFNNHLVPT